MSMGAAGPKGCVSRRVESFFAELGRHQDRIARRVEICLTAPSTRSVGRGRVDLQFLFLFFVRGVTLKFQSSLLALCAACVLTAVPRAGAASPQDAPADAHRVVEVDAVKRSWAMDPRDAVVIDPGKLLLGISGCALGSHTDYAWSDNTLGHPRFTMAWPGRRHIWNGATLIPIDPTVYPIFVATYRATNVVTTRFWDFHVAMRTKADLPGKYNFVRMDNPDTSVPMIADGKLRELRVDTRKVHLSPDDAVIATNPLTSMWLGVRAGLDTPASFELVGMRMESVAETRRSEPYENATPIRFRVTDPEGEAVGGATVTVDAQRINFARSAKSDVFGWVSLTPLENMAGVHTVRVEKEGWMPAEFHDLRVGGHGAVDLVMEKAVVYRGRVVDERGAGISNVAVRMYPAAGGSGRSGGRSMTRVAVATGPDGRWVSPPMPAGVEQLCLRFTHIDYVSDREAEVKPGHSAEQLVREYPVSVMRDGVRIRGRVYPAPGQTLYKVESQLILGGHSEPKLRWASDDGFFDLGTIEPGVGQLTLKAKGHQDVVIDLSPYREDVVLDVQMEE